MNKSNFNDQADSQTVLNQLVLEFMREQKRKRRGRWITRIIILIVGITLIYKMSGLTEESHEAKDKPHVGLIDVEGSIFDKESASADHFLKGMKMAYKSHGLQAMIFRINSPGGSPVQADYIYNAIRYYSKQYPKIKTYAVCVDICASAAYYIAAGADEIYANPASLVGSIGVLYNGFGFTDALQKLGISRRLQTAGVNKGFLDPFSPEDPKQKELLQTVLNQVHQQFIDKVKAGRGDRLIIDDQTFSGLFWTGQQAKEKGLIDGFASAGQLAKEKVNVDKMIDYTYKQTVFEKMTKSLGEMAGNPLASVLGLHQSVLLAQ